MKKVKISGLILMVMTLFTLSCEKSDTPSEQSLSPQLPPAETMAIDFEAFDESGTSGKSSITSIDEKAPNGNWVFSRVVVGVWSTALYSTLSVPVTAFHAAFSQTPEMISEDTWQWSYSVEGFTSEYTARLTGQLTAEAVLWNMYITKTGIEGYDEFLWFTGSSSLDGNSGFWILNQGPERQDPMLRIDWERAGEEIGSIRYTWVRELNDQGNDDLFRNSYLEYGLQDAYFDAYFDAYVYDVNLQGFAEVEIEWSRETFEGRVRSFAYFEDEMWHCWDSNGDDVACE